MGSGLRTSSEDTRRRVRNLCPRTIHPPKSLVSVDHVASQRGNMPLVCSRDSEGVVRSRIPTDDTADYPLLPSFTSYCTCRSLRLQRLPSWLLPQRKGHQFAAAAACLEETKGSNGRKRDSAWLLEVRPIDAPSEADGTSESQLECRGSIRYDVP